MVGLTSCAWYPLSRRCSFNCSVLQVHLEDGTIRTDLYCKPTDRHQYLQRKSCHPCHTKTAIPYSQALRLRRICSQDEDFECRTEQLKEHLRLRGYHAQEVKPAIQRAASLQRTHCLQPRERERDRSLHYIDSGRHQSALH